MSLYERVARQEDQPISEAWNSDDNKIATVNFYWGLKGKTDEEIEAKKRVLAARLDKFIGRIGVKYSSDSL